MDDAQFKRRQVVDYYEKHQPCSFCRVAKRFGVSSSYVHKWVQRKQATGNVDTVQRTDPKAELRAAMKAKMVKLAEDTDYSSADRLARQLQSEFNVPVSASTVRRWLREQGMEYALPLVQPLLTVAQRAKRRAFAVRYKRLPWDAVLMTDSKVFYCFPPRKGSLLRTWSKKGQRRVVYTVKHSQKVHVYLGVCSRGVSKLYVCSGTTGRPSQYKNSQTGKPHSGVCALEYQQQIAPSLIADAQQLFKDSTLYRNSWMYQQDGAPIHTTKDSVATINSLVPAGLLEGWPPNSPDLNWIENVWAWMEKELRRKPTCHTAAELEQALIAVWEDLRSHHQPMLKNLAKSMPKRLSKVLDLDGAHTGY